MRLIFISLCACLCLLHAKPTLAEDEPAPIGYLSLDPEIVTNYVTGSSSRIGFLRIAIELMVSDLAMIPAAEHHLPLMRAVIIDVIGKKDESQIKSLTGRESLRIEILKELRMALKSEMGDEVIKDLFFTKYLYNT
ncbi:MAG: flagellar basal body-associated FliL family protein [Glaciecola sp.]|jgi:flagellar protein FliL|nr:flagellar basal body-associated FliL family protein [Glaciecola sp.]MDG1816832.1 flagellar basal body-associated FliL family protein [Glaciecola sp.]MDG2099038.1 flagellar basal body-associated FliL family protein [Glaciecola sp.]